MTGDVMGVNGGMAGAALRDPSLRALVEPAVVELLAAELWRRTGLPPRGDRAT